MKSLLAPARFSLAVLVTVGAALSSACAAGPDPAPLPVFANEENLSVLVGEWWGEYSSADTGRDGRIRFSLEADAETAFGDVLMFPATTGEAFPSPSADRPDRPDGPAPRGPQTLTIRFVRLKPEDETITGTLDAYDDPTCDCTLSTTFTGRVSADRIEGTFVTKGGPGRQESRGRWRVDRQEESGDEVSEE